jgi:hypothetical protein
MGDQYFTRLHQLRNDSAQESRRNGVAPSLTAAELAPAGGGSAGCESMHNDSRDAEQDGQKGCEAI